MAIVDYFLRRKSIPLLFGPGLSTFKARYATCAFPVETSKIGGGLGAAISGNTKRLLIYETN
jgi:hypothetical protein